MKANLHIPDFGPSEPFKRLFGTDEQPRRQLEPSPNGCNSEMPLSPAESLAAQVAHTLLARDESEAARIMAEQRGNRLVAAAVSDARRRNQETDIFEAIMHVLARAGIPYRLFPGLGFILELIEWLCREVNYRGNQLAVTKESIRTWDVTEFLRVQRALQAEHDKETAGQEGKANPI